MCCKLSGQGSSKRGGDIILPCTLTITCKLSSKYTQTCMRCPSKRRLYGYNTVTYGSYAVKDGTVARRQIVIDPFLLVTCLGIPIVNHLGSLDDSYIIRTVHSCIIWHLPDFSTENGRYLPVAAANTIE